MKTTKTNSLSKIGMLALGLAGGANVQTSATIRVPQDQPSIQAGINAATNGETVLVSSGTYQEHDITITKAVTLKAVSGRSVTTIDAQSLGVILSASSTSTNWVKIQGFTVTGGYAPHGHAGGGDGISWNSGFLEVSNCIIENCTGDGVPGGNSSGLNYWNNIRFIDCTVRNNSVENFAGLGGATVIRCTLYGNYGWNETAVLLSCDSYNCTIANNPAQTFNPWFTGGMYGTNRAVNCILWGNGGYNGQQIDTIVAPATVTYSIVQGGFTGTGNLNLDPLFLNAGNADFHLLANSPAIDAGDPNPIYNDPDASRSDMGAYPYLDIISLVKAVKPSFSRLRLGTSYQLQVSGNLNNWTNQGSPFPATNASMIYPQYWDVDNWTSLFFRLQVVP